MRVASFNIFFFGHRPAPPELPKVERDAGDLDLLARVIARLDADVVVFQEIFDRPLLGEVLGVASARRPGRDWQIAAASHDDPRAKYQVVVAVDRARVTVDRWDRPVPLPVDGPRDRPPVVVDLAVDGATVQVVGVHLKSGLLDEPADGADATRRARECARLAAWIREHPVPRRVLLGDFNAFADHPSLAGLRALEGLAWPAHRWPAGARRWTTHLDAAQFDPCAIDHVAVSGLDAEAVDVLCFDRSDEEARDGASWREWLSSEARFQHVSDHRPVWVDLA